MPNSNADQSSEFKWLAADWPAPSHVHAGTTLRHGGISSPPYDQLNLATHVDDDLGSVLNNRQRLLQYLNLPAEPIWLKQVHGNVVAVANAGLKQIETSADACYSTQTNTVCAVMTADCLPLLLCDDQGAQIAAVHIGWRGFCKNIISVALEQFTCPNNQIMAWLGPCICAKHYETGTEVRDACLAVCEGATDVFTTAKDGHVQTDLHRLVSVALNQQGVQHIYGEQRCTYEEDDDFYSYRKNKTTGRMASLIWMA